jgi:Tol biopolymer transport system component
MQFVAGTALGPYQIVAALGAGGMGEVYRARDTRLPRDVAIKVLPSAFSADVERLRRFEQEARAAAALNHPNILVLYDIGSHEAAPYLVTELLEGATLREQLRGGALPVRQAVDYAVQIARGLAAAHDKGIIHRDLKPENAFVTTDGRIKILDFGLAKLTESNVDLAGASQLPTMPPQTNPGVVLGTAGYMAPEQVRGVAVDQRSDIFACGVILYEMLSGQRAFLGDTAMDSMTAILKDDPPDLLAADRRIPVPLERIVDRCLRKSPSARFQTATDLAFALDALSVQSGTGEALAGADTRSHARSWWTSTAVAVVVAAAAVVGALVYSRRTLVDTPVYRNVFVPPVSLGGPAFGRLALSPDGRRLAFIGENTNGVTILWVRSLDGVTAQPLAGTEGALSPFWSADSRFIGFVAGGKLKKIDPAGGPAVTLSDAGNPVPGTWNRDDVIVFARGVAGGGLSRVAGTGGTPAATTALDVATGETVHGFPSFLPDGRHFLYVATNQTTNQTKLYLGSLDSGERQFILDGVINVQYAQGHLLFMRGTTLMAQPFDPSRLTLAGEAAPLAEQVETMQNVALGAFTASETGVLAYQQVAATAGASRLVWFDRRGKQVGVLGERSGYEGEVSLSPDGSHAAVALRDAGASDIWVFDVARGIRSRFTFDPGIERVPIFSPDGSRILFSAGRTGSVWELRQKASSGAAADEPLLAMPGTNLIAESWSRDGRFLLYSAVRSQEGSTFDAWVLPLVGDRKSYPFAQSAFAEMRSQFSPDVRWVAYASNESGRFEVYVAPFPNTGAKWQVSTAGGNDPRWSADGRQIFYIAENNKLMAANVMADRERFSVGSVEPLFDVRPPPARGVYDVTRDGRFLVTTVEQQGESPPITIVVNWPATLKR